MTIPVQIFVRIYTFENKKLQPVPGEYRLNSGSEFKFDQRQAYDECVVVVLFRLLSSMTLNSDDIDRLV